MPDQQITDLAAASSIIPSDVSVLVQGSTDLQYTFAQLLTFLAGNLTVGAAISYGTGAIPASSSGNNGDLYIKTDTGQFALKSSGTWTVFYTVPAGVVGSQLTFGSVAPTNPATTGVLGDVYINTVTGSFYKQTSVSSVNTWVLQFTMTTGPSGPRGTSILNGAANPLSTDGVDGDFWVNTTAHTLFGPKVSGAWPGIGLALTPGIPNTISSGATNPDNANGNNGDYYINTTSWNIFGPKTSGAWGSGTSLIGPGNAAPEILAVITAGTAIPFNIDMTTGTRLAFGLKPTVICEIVYNGDVTKLLEFPAIQVVRNYTNSSRTVLASIDIYGNDDGTGHFNEDSYVTLKP